MVFSPRNVKVKESTETRRARGEIACAECRRKKLKCSRTIPCDRCMQRGCEVICPNGLYDAIQHTQSDRKQRAAPARKSASAMKQRVALLRRRIQQLEDALQVSHSAQTEAPHPLLSNDLLLIKSTSRWQPQTRTDLSGDGDLVNSVGILAMLGQGVEFYLGPDRFLADVMVTPETLLQKLNTILSGTVPRVPLSLVNLPGNEKQAKIIERHLPSIERATALIEAYFENILWMCEIVDREQVMEELVPRFYNTRGPSQTTEERDLDSAPNPHELCLLFAIFACGSAFDFSLPPWNDEGDVYYQVASTAFNLASDFESTSVSTLQALALLISYNHFSCRRKSLENAWGMISVGVSLAASIGLFRDPSHFELPPKLVQRRRRVFWELYTADLWKTIGSGRPAMFHRSVVDCEFPEDKEALATETEIPFSTCRMRYRFSKEILTVVAEKLSFAAPLRYSDILAVDKKIRDFDPIYLPKSSIDGSIRELSLKFLPSFMKDATLVQLHRPFFSRAMVENPTDPLKSRFAPSVSAVYRSNIACVQVIRELHEKCPQYVERIWSIWAHALLSALILGSIASRATESLLTPQAYTVFIQSLNMLEKVQMIHPIVNELMPMLCQLREQGSRCLTINGMKTPTYTMPMPLSSPENEDDKDKIFSSASEPEQARTSIEGHSHKTPQRPISTPDHTVQTIMPSLETKRCQPGKLQNMALGVEDGSALSSNVGGSPTIEDLLAPATGNVDPAIFGSGIPLCIGSAPLGLPDMHTDTDFDITGMFRSWGAESYLPLASDSMAPWQTFLQDSRLFGRNAATYSDDLHGEIS